MVLVNSKNKNMTEKKQISNEIQVLDRSIKGALTADTKIDVFIKKYLD